MCLSLFDDGYSSNTPLVSSLGFFSVWSMVEKAFFAKLEARLLLVGGQYDTYKVSAQVRACTRR